MLDLTPETKAKTIGQAKSYVRVAADIVSREAIQLHFWEKSPVVGETPGVSATAQTASGSSKEPPSKNLRKNRSLSYHL